VATLNCGMNNYSRNPLKLELQKLAVMLEFGLCNSHHRPSRAARCVAMNRFKVGTAALGTISATSRTEMGISRNDRQSLQGCLPATFVTRTPICVAYRGVWEYLRPCTLKAVLA